MTRCTAVVLALLATLIAGCASVRSEDPARAALEPQPIDRTHWPEAPDEAWFDATLDASPAYLWRERIVASKYFGDVLLDRSPRYRVVEPRRTQRGVLRTLVEQDFGLERTEREGVPIPESVRTELARTAPDRSDTTMTLYTGIPEDSRFQLDGTMMQFLRPGEDGSAGLDDDPSLIGRASGFSWDALLWRSEHTVTIHSALPLSGEGVPEEGPRGTLIYIPGIQMTEYDRAVRDAFIENGWAVGSGRMLSLFHSIDRVPVGPESDAAQLVGPVAAFMNELLPHRALAFEALVEEMHRRDPRLAGRPVVIAAFSAGAIGAPTIAAHRPDLYDAMILVSGGANIASIARRAAKFRRVKFEVEKGFEVPDSFYEAFDRAYLDAAPTDPYHTAPALVDMPILMLHGSSDDWVPADTGDVLWERLGRPERWTFPGGHKLVFWRLPSLAGKLERWAREHAGVESALTN